MKSVPSGLCEVCWNVSDNGVLETGALVPQATHGVPRVNGEIMQICASCAAADYWELDGITPMRLAVKAPKAVRALKVVPLAAGPTIEASRSFFECAGCHGVCVLEGGSPLNLRALQPCCRMYLPQALRASA